MEHVIDQSKRLAILLYQKRILAHYYSITTSQSDHYYDFYALSSHSCKAYINILQYYQCFNKNYDSDSALVYSLVHVGITPLYIPLA